MARVAQHSVSVLFLALLASPAGAGSVYQFEDEQGVVHYTNVPSDPRYGFVRTDPEPPRSGGAPTDPRSASASDSGALSRGLRAFGQIIRSTAERYGVDTRLVEAVVQVESAGNPMAVSPKGARGLMQLMPERAVELGVRDSFDPRQNVDGGVRHMRDLLQRFGGDVTLALAAYNAGESAVRAHGGIPPYTETREYVKRVRAVYESAGGATPTKAAVALVTAPQRIYRAVDEDGTVTFTNLPPRAASPAPGRF
jgi:soluble lytic murein transglycosylase